MSIRFPNNWSGHPSSLFYDVEALGEVSSLESKMPDWGVPKILLSAGNFTLLENTIKLHQHRLAAGHCC
ncbi:hypothetical protein [Streptococcus sanguinis]|uniref:Uncharacterized protein n=1 Tax=Streptococcus sanguinis TaxID=1305 RepID=A0A3P1SC78_STRSA|nr:hypothetical protein [Streptococcus sanguinis]MCY7027878.1 hypothetical protein [Streptococcus sanguinis]RRC93902.1 hypothetical protein EII39_00830 [Streptococcus sanguinis]